LGKQFCEIFCVLSMLTENDDFVVHDGDTRWLLLFLVYLSFIQHLR